MENMKKDFAAKRRAMELDWKQQEDAFNAKVQDAERKLTSKIAEQRDLQTARERAQSEKEQVDADKVRLERECMFMLALRHSLWA